MPAPIYAATTGGVVALAAATAKTVLGFKAGTTFAVMLLKWRASFDGVSASGVPVLVEVCSASYATNPPGTASTSVTPVQQSGRVLAVGATAAKNWTTEPTVVTVIEEFLVTPNGGLLAYDFSLGTEPDTPLGEGFLLRMNAPAAVNVRASMHLSRC